MTGTQLHLFWYTVFFFPTKKIQVHLSVTTLTVTSHTRLYYNPHWYIAEINNREAHSEISQLGCWGSTPSLMVVPNNRCLTQPYYCFHPCDTQYTESMCLHNIKGKLQLLQTVLILYIIIRNPIFFIKKIINTSMSPGTPDTHWVLAYQ